MSYNLILYDTIIHIYICNICNIWIYIYIYVYTCMYIGQNINTPWPSMALPWGPRWAFLGAVYGPHFDLSMGFPLSTQWLCFI